ncbi:hypothetical protein RA086_11295 [Lactiplantibacillus sp. WILCCON 0030]|uniref:Integral membrane protein n=1 Tax=Lactiplantibacillus brownii TaxID=3069269 RepID=A0ABU1ACT9_9LACO|nr:hypothetical protein [Lactiplantibacillus brownii]MDQ7938193.1 hypothetical protein [Lactiplantibacillus brownii]
MKPLNQDAIILRLGLVTGCWVLVQLLLLPSALLANATVLRVSADALLAIILTIGLLDGYRAWKQRLNWRYAATDLVLLILVAILLW